MSQWTQVNCQIRFDYTQFPTTNFYLLPEGSEGGLHTQMWTNPDNVPITKFVLSVFGSLRDFGTDKDIKKLLTWFKIVCKENNIRQAVLEIDTINEHNVFMFSEIAKKVIKLKKV